MKHNFQISMRMNHLISEDIVCEESRLCHRNNSNSLKLKLRVANEVWKWIFYRNVFDWWNALIFLIIVHFCLKLSLVMVFQNTHAIRVYKYKHIWVTNRLIRELQLLLGIWRVTRVKNWVQLQRENNRSKLNIKCLKS